ncbi:MAG TPA: sugar MFS transporter [Verrucomicrobiae bacterium]|nr:sugar MFS transporter [Verrucomicrobiae bacterium]
MATIVTTQSASSSLSGNGRTYRGPFAIMTVLFFMWGFMTVFNDILIPRFKDAFGLNYFEAMLVQFAFFGAYFIGSLAYFYISAIKGDPIARIGYKNGVVIGLLISAFGSALFYPAAKLTPYSWVMFKSTGGTNLTQVGSPVLTVNDIKDVPSLVSKLRQHSDPATQFLWGQFTEETRTNLLAYSGTEDQNNTIKVLLSEQLNQIIRTDSIYTNQSAFAGVPLSEQTKLLGSQKLEGHPLFRFNRLVLEDVFPQEITKAPNLIGAKAILEINAYPLFLLALFIIGLGFAMLQIACNPYVTILGPERTASSRLNLAQAFNSLGTTTGPLIGGYLIFQYFAKTGAHGAESVKIPYLIFCIVFVILAAIFFSIRLPHVGEGKVEPGVGALKYPHVVLGVLAIFMYVGGEVSVGSAIINFLGQPNVAAMSALEASKYVSLFWGGMLIGRFMGAVELSEMKKANKQLWLVAIPVLAFLLFWVLRSWDSDQHQFDFSAGWVIVKNYLPLVAFCWLLFQFGKGLAGRTLFIFSATIVVLLAISILFGGKLAMWCIVGIGLFTSIGWPNIFSLALDRMGVLKSQVSSLLVMAVVGGAVLPAILGRIADVWNLQAAFIVPLIAYAYVAFYGIAGHKIGRGKLPEA